MEQHSCLAQDAKKLKGDRGSWRAAGQLAPPQQAGGAAQQQCFPRAPFTDLQSTTAAASLMPPKTHTNFSLGSSKLEPYTKGNSWKGCFRMVELTQYKTVARSNSYVLHEFVSVPHTRPPLLQSFASHPSYRPKFSARRLAKCSHRPVSTPG